MFNFFWQSMHVTNTYAILFIALAKTGDIGIPYDEKFFYIMARKLSKFCLLIIGMVEIHHRFQTHSSWWPKPLLRVTKTTPQGDQNHSSGWYRRVQVPKPLLRVTKTTPQGDQNHSSRRYRRVEVLCPIYIYIFFFYILCLYLFFKSFTRAFFLVNIFK